MRFPRKCWLCDYVASSARDMLEHHKRDHRESWERFVRNLVLATPDALKRGAG